MGFFSDLKEDLSQAVNELMPQEQTPQQAEAGQEGGSQEQPFDSVSGVSLDEMLKNIDDIQLTGDMTAAGDSVSLQAPEADAAKETQTAAVDPGPDGASGRMEAETDREETLGRMEAGTEEVQMTADVTMEPETGLRTAEEQDMEQALAQIMEEEPGRETPEDEGGSQAEEILEEVQKVQIEENEKDEDQKEESKGAEETMEMEERVVLDETSVITAGMVVTGDLNTQGSLDVAGTVNGNIETYGKLNITGHVNGNSKAAEIYAENAKINGEIVSEGAVKIESSTVIIGNISAASAAIAGAVKGDIDVKGPVILDASAIVMGNIKSKSVQINNGAVIEGMCSQCYADVNPTTFFEDYKPDIQTKSKSK